MRKKHRFRKMYFICNNKVVIEPQIQFIPVFQYKDYANTLCVQQGAHFIWEDQSKPIPVKSVEGFYLVHESLYDKILKDHDEDAK